MTSLRELSYSRHSTIFNKHTKFVRLYCMHSILYDEILLFCRMFIKLLMLWLLDFRRTSLILSLFHHISLIFHSLLLAVVFLIFLSCIHHKYYAIAKFALSASDNSIHCIHVSLVNLTFTITSHTHMKSDKNKIIHTK